jgi:hypothetical protein
LPSTTSTFDAIINELIQLSYHYQPVLSKEGIDIIGEALALALGHFSLPLDLPHLLSHHVLEPLLSAPLFLLLSFFGALPQLAPDFTLAFKDAPESVLAFLLLLAASHPFLRLAPLLDCAFPAFLGSCARPLSWLVVH